MRIFVTGATGFIGSNLIKALARQTNHAPCILRKMSSTFEFEKDIKSGCEMFEMDANADNIYQIIQSARPDMIIHLASLTQRGDRKGQIDQLIQSNILFPTKLLEAMVGSGVKHFINTGTSWEHFNGCEDYDPVDLYASTKKAFEDILQYYVNAHNINALTIKLFDTYGPNDLRPKLFSFFKNANNQEPTDLSPGEQYLDLLYIDDVTSAYIKAIDYLTLRKHGNLESVFIGYGQSYQLKEIVSMYENISGTPLNIRWGGRAYREREVMRAQANIKESREKLNWKPKVDLREGLSKLLSFDDK